ncbi:MAG: GGDEF domain-containing protein [Acidobacteriota bacterium]|nr:GGDEF domain-containing protein [Acidobacteriota bacterium]
MNYDVIPSLFALAILVAVFRAILRQRNTERLELWLTGWFLVLVHFVAQFVQVGQGAWARWMSACNLSFLELATIVFLISFSPMAEDRRHQYMMAAGLGIPSLLYTNAPIWNITSHAFFYAVIVLAFSSTVLLAWQYYRKLTLYVAGLVTASLLVSVVMAYCVARNHTDIGLTVLLFSLNLAAAVLYWLRFPRSTAGVLTTSGGFVAWGAVFPCYYLLTAYVPTAHVESEVWNLPKYFVAVGMILTLLEDQIQRSEYLAHHDELTGLPNLRLLLDRMDQAMAHAKRSSNKLAVLLLDLDNFKEVNDTYGHRIGDLLLQHTVLRLTTRMRVSDTLSRSGGDEFTVISEIASPQGAEVLVSALKSALSIPFRLEGNLISASVSIGFALYPDDGIDTDSLRAAADNAMYAAKRASRMQSASKELFQSAKSEPHAIS